MIEAFLDTHPAAAERPAPIVIQPGTALYRLIGKVALLQTDNKPGMLLVRVDCGIITFGRFVPDGRAE